MLIIVMVSLNFSFRVNAKDSDNTNGPMLYGTVEIKIKENDELDLRNSYYRVLVKDDDDGNIIIDIKAVSNNVNTQKAGEYKI